MSKKLGAGLGLVLGLVVVVVLATTGVMPWAAAIPAPPRVEALGSMARQPGRSFLRAEDLVLAAPGLFRSSCRVCLSPRPRS